MSPAAGSATAIMSPISWVKMDNRRCAEDAQVKTIVTPLHDHTLATKDYIVITKIG
jgi:hypothetical protein